MPLESKYLRAIYATARENGVSNEELHDAIFAGWKKKSVKDLTRHEAFRLLDGLRGENLKRDYARRQAQHFHGRRNYDASGDAVQLVSAADLQLVTEAAALRGWNEAGLEKFIQRQIGRPEIRTMAELNKVFWPLKAMNERDGLYVRPPRRRG